MVLARRTDVRFTGRLDALALLATLQERDPRSYQAFLQARPLGSGCRSANFNLT